MRLLIPFAISLFSAGAVCIPADGKIRRFIFGAGAILSSIAAIAIAEPVLVSGTELIWGPLRLDRFAAYVICLVALVAALAALASVRYLAHGEKEHAISPVAERAYCAFFPLFVLSMWTAAAADNLALLWIALESTTLTTTLLVAFDRTHGAVEAAWKYIIICSTGIILGLLGVLMLIHAAAGADLGAGALAFSSLRAHAGALSAETLKWAFVFLFIGVGTKVGFVPMHTWLPDAHSKTPAPISAMLSGILLNVAFVVLLRAKSVVDAALTSSAWTGTFFLVFGILSILLPAFILLVQKNYKRMLAYSSVEHMGLMAFAVGLGPFGIVPATMHMAGHALCKPALFIGAGEILHDSHTTSIDTIQGVIDRLPKTGVLFFTALLALLAAPPSALFMSEFLITSYGMTMHPVLTLVVLTLLVIASFAMMRSVVGMLFAPTHENETHAAMVKTPEKWNLTNIVMLIDIILCIAFGIALLSGQGLHFFTALTQSII